MSTATQTARDLSRFARVPEPLVRENRWMLWGSRVRDGKPTKVPLRVDGETHADVTDPANYFTYAEVLAAYADGKGDGIGFALGDGWCGFDLDHSLTDAGELKPWATDIIAPFDTYVEGSPGRAGVKGFGRGRHRVIDRTANGEQEKDAGTRKTRIKLGAEDAKEGEAIEAYFGGRFFTVTGQTYPGFPGHIADIEAPLIDLYNRLKPPPAPRAPSAASSYRFDGSDDDLIRKACAALNGDKFRRLLDGDTSDYANDDSGADQALCNLLAFWTNKDPGRMDAIFRRSGLFRDKWDEQRGATTYGERTIASAIDYTVNTYDPNRNGNGKIGSAYQHAQGHGRHREDPKPEEPPIDLKASVVTLGQLWQSDPTLRDPVIDGMLRRGQVGNLISVSKSYKTYMMIGLATAMVSGRSWLDTFPTIGGRVLLIDMELQRPDITRRTYDVAQAMHVELSTVAENIDVLSLRGRNATVDKIEPMLMKAAPRTWSLVILDPLYKTYPGGFDENSNPAMTELYRRFERIAEHLDCGLLIVHHASKGAQGQKAVVDVGAGAGAQARSADAHITIREHEVPDCVVLDARVRSFKPVEPIVLRFTYPKWERDIALDPAQLKTGGKRARNEDKAQPLPKEKPEPWTVDRFVAEFCKADPIDKKTIVARASIMPGMSTRKADDLIRVALADGKLHLWPSPDKRVLRVATCAPTLHDMPNTENHQKPTRKRAKAPRKAA